MLDGHFRTVHKLIDGVDGSADIILVGVKGMPVIHVVELKMDAVVVVVAVSKEELGFVDELQVVVGQVVDIVLNHNFNQLTCVCVCVCVCVRVFDRP